MKITAVESLQWAEYPRLMVVLTGMGTIPPNDFTLTAGDVITITIGDLGVL